MVLARKYIYVKEFDGMPTNDNLKIVEEELPELKDGEYLVEAVYLSVDPYMRAYAPSYKIGDTMIGSQVAKVIQSKSSKYTVGKYVVGAFGWRSHSIAKDDAAVTGWQTPHIVPFEPTDKIPISYALGVLGMPGCTAHLGLMEVCKPQAGETVVVSGAAGAVGSIVGQIAKIKGCTVIGITGSDEKGKWLKSLGFDHVINYKTQDLEKGLAEAATNGVDCYYDNVGGETSSIVIHKMNRYGRVAVCGAISGYNSKGGYPKEYLVEAIYLSVDPYMRAYAPSYTIGDTLIGSQVAKVIDSKSSKFPVGKYVVGGYGWRSHTIAKESVPVTAWTIPHIVPFQPTEKIPLSYALGVLGMPGNTAYFGLLEICKPKPGETVAISGAAGAVGSIVGQIAKIKGCKVVGIAGSDEKGEWLKSLGFDEVINYKTQDLQKALAIAAPKGIDCYFDNVGGETSSIVLQKMNRFGRIAVCGAISSYNATEDAKATIVQRPMVMLGLTMTGFVVDQFLEKWREGILQILQWVQEGKIKSRETITEGFENTLNALIGVLKGENTGKAVVKC